MKNFTKSILLALLLVFSLSSYAQSQNMSPTETRQFITDAITYAVNNMDPNLDYSKYVSPNYIQHIDGQTMNFCQWAQHMKDIKALMKSQKVVIENVIAESNEAAINETVYNTKKDGSQIVVKVIGFFKIKNHKMIYGDELTYLIKGPKQDKNIGSLN